MALLTLLLLTVLTPPEAPAQVLNVRTYSHADGLPQVQVVAVHQDRLGYMWVGTYGGLTRYDGRDFRTWTTREGLSSNRVTALDETADGTLVVGTAGGGVCFFAPPDVECVTREEGLAHDAVIHVLPEADGSVWVSTEAGLTLVRERRPVRTYGPDDGLPDGEVHQVLRDDEGRLWANTAGGTALFEDDAFVLHQPRDPAGRAVMLPSPLGMFFGGPGGLFRHGPDGLEQISVPGFPVAVTFLGAAYGAGEAWFATRNGAVRFDGEGAEVIDGSRGLTSDHVHDVLVDREENVWFGTERGLAKLVPGPLALFTEAEGLPNPVVRTLGQDPDGRLWAGTRDGVAIYDGSRFRSQPLPSGVTDTRVYSLAPGPDGGMLVGTRGGLAHFGDRGPTVYQTDDGLPSPYVTSLARDGERVWLGTDAGVAVLEDGAIRPADHPELRDAYVVTMKVDERGRLWVGRRAGGVSIKEGATVTTLGRDDGLTDQTIWSLSRGRDGGMWIGSNGQGAFHVLGDSIRRYTVRDGLNDDFVWQVLADTRGYVWMFTSNGLDRLGPDGFTHYGTGDGVIDPEGTATAALEDTAGRLWFGSGSGVYRYDPEKEFASDVPPPIYVVELAVGDETFRPDEASIPPDAGFVTVRFAAPSFRNEQALRFRFRVEDREWSEPSREPYVSLADLRPGQHALEAMAVTDSGLESEVATARFTVLPAWWQTWWFRTLLALALLAMIAGVPVARARRAAAESRRLERVVAERTGELEERKSELEREVEDRIAAERARRQSEEKLRDILENSTNLFYAHNADHELTYVSPQARDFFDCEPEEALVNWASFLTDHPENAIGMEATERALETGERQPPYELELEGAKGRRIWVEVREAPVVRNGNTVSIVGSLTDITEARQAREERRRLQDAVMETRRMEALGRMAGGMAHDFNNLLTSVQGYAELAAADLPDDHPAHEDLARIRDSSERGAELVDRLLAFTRQQVAHRQKVELGDAVAATMPIVENLFEDDVRVVVEADPEPAWVEIDSRQLERLLVELAVNARDAMPEGGRLSVIARPVRFEEVLDDGSPDAVPSGAYGLLRVEDDGAGMGADVVERIFEPFFTTKSMSDHSGLGLASVYGMVKQHDGYLQVASAPGEGTTFEVYFPMAEAPDAKASGSEEAPDGEARNERVALIVEDEPAVLRLMQRALEHSGFEVKTAEDGAAAVEVCQAAETPIDLLVTDVIMPGLNGQEVADAVREVFPDVRVLFVSGYTAEVLGEKGILGPEVELLGKPFTLAELRQRVEQLVGATKVGTSDVAVPLP